MSNEILPTQIWVLRTRTFVGALAYAQHYMGSLKPPDLRDNPNIYGGGYGWPPPEVPVEHVLTEEYAKRLSTPDFTYRPGWECEKFFSKEEVIAAAKELFQQVAKPGDILMSEYEYLTAGNKPLDTKEESTLSLCLHCGSTLPDDAEQYGIEYCETCAGMPGES